MQNDIKKQARSNGKTNCAKLCHREALKVEYLGYTINISFSNSRYWTFSVSEKGMGKIGDSGEEEFFHTMYQIRDI